MRVTPFAAVLAASLSFSLAAKIGEPCGALASFFVPKECEGGDGVQCVALEGGNVCANVAMFGERCGREINTGCVTAAMGLASDDMVCSRGFCATTYGLGAGCASASDCSSSPNAVEQLGADRCAGGCFRCKDGQCMSKAHVREICAGVAPNLTSLYYSFAACDDGLVCDPNVLADPGQERVVVSAPGVQPPVFAKNEGGVCVLQGPPVGQLGSECYLNGVRCADGLYCTQQGEDFRSRVCTKRAGVGEACDAAAHVLCNIPDEAVPQVPFLCEGGVCAAPPVERGAPCNKALGYNCDPDDECEEKTLTCEVVRASRGVFPTRSSERCVSRSIPIGGGCSMGPSGGETLLCVPGAFCQSWPPTSQWSGRCAQSPAA
jgi:hypothetical protein